MVTFPEEIHPKRGLKVRFDYEPRATQYLQYFGIITGHPEYIFQPLNVKFQSSGDLNTFLRRRGVIYDEVEVSSTFNQIKTEFTVVDTTRIHDVEESITKYLEDYKYYSINEVADMLSFSRPTIYKLINNGSLIATRIHGQLRIRHADLMNFISKNSV